MAVIKHVPNLISLARLIMVPIMVWLIVENHMVGAFWVFVAAGVSDAVDGLIAKKFHAESELGAFLDPLADKALLICAYIMLGYQGYLPVWLVILVVFRDVLIIGGALLYQVLTNRLSMHPMMISKVNTVAQIILVALALGGLGMGYELGQLIGILVYVVAVTTVASGAVYVWTWGRMAMMEEGTE